MRAPREMTLEEKKRPREPRTSPWLSLKPCLVIDRDSPSRPCCLSLIIEISRSPSHCLMSESKSSCSRPHTLPSATVLPLAHHLFQSTLALAHTASCPRGHSLALSMITASPRPASGWRQSIRHARSRACVRACMRACVRACMRACVCAFVRATHPAPPPVDVTCARARVRACDTQQPWRDGPWRAIVNLCQPTQPARSKQRGSSRGGDDATLPLTSVQTLRS
jgi:hypothetical protein